MRFSIVHNNGTISHLSGGCYGCIGRTDSYSPKDTVRDDVESINDNNGYETSYYDPPSWRSNRSPAVLLRLPRDFFDNGGTFHANNRALMTYLVERSPWAECFTQTVDQIMSTETIDLKAQGVSSELVISLGYILRSMDSLSFSLNWKFIRNAAPEVPELLSMLLCFSMKELYQGRDHIYLGSGDGNLFPMNTSFSKILTASPDLSGLSIQDVGGYVMNVAHMWEGSNKSGYAEGVIESVIRKYSSVHKVQGVFGEYSISGIVDARSFILDVYETIKGE